MVRTGSQVQIPQNFQMFCKQGRNRFALAVTAVSKIDSFFRSHCSRFRRPRCPRGLGADIAKNLGMVTTDSSKPDVGSLRVKVLHAKGLRLNTDGKDPSPFVRMRLLLKPKAGPPECFQTIKSEGVNPKWNETHFFRVPLAMGKKSNLEVAFCASCPGLCLMTFQSRGENVLWCNIPRCTPQITLWDTNKPMGTPESFLGEVMLDLAKLSPHIEKIVEQGPSKVQNASVLCMQILP